jgi:hypothetical protein
VPYARRRAAKLVARSRAVRTNTPSVPSVVTDAVGAFTMNAWQMRHRQSFSWTVSGPPSLACGLKEGASGVRVCELACPVTPTNVRPAV